jgi:hypothetical protein
LELILAVVGGLIEEVGVHEEGGAGDKRDENENLDRVLELLHLFPNPM